MWGKVLFNLSKHNTLLSGRSAGYCSRMCSNIALSWSLQPPGHALKQKFCELQFYILNFNIFLKIKLDMLYFAMCKCLFSTTCSLLIPFWIQTQPNFLICDRVDLFPCPLKNILQCMILINMILNYHLNIIKI